MSYIQNYIKYNICNLNPKAHGNYLYTFEGTDDSFYQYNEHPYIDKIFINNNLTEITFILHECNPNKELFDSVHKEMIRIFFSLILSLDNIPFNNPTFTFNSTSYKEYNINDKFYLHDKLTKQYTIAYDDLYKHIFEIEINTEQHRTYYSELLAYLQIPQISIVYLGLYDRLSTLISKDNDRPQKKLHDFLGRNKSLYSKIEFTKSKTGKPSDSLTDLRNILAHSSRYTPNDYYEAIKSISNEHIRYILKIINDILCGKVH